MELKDRVKIARIKAGLTQAQLAMQSNLSQSAINGLEKGKFKNSRRIIKIANALNVSPQWLENGDQKLLDLSIKKSNIIKIPLLNWDKLNAENFTPVKFRNFIAANKNQGEMLQMVLETELPVSAALAALPIINLDAMFSPVPNKLSLFDNDKIIFDANLQPSPGQLVIAQTNEGILVRQYMLNAGKPFLKALNPSYPIIRSNFQILATIIEIYRKI